MIVFIYFLLLILGQKFLDNIICSVRYVGISVCKLFPCSISFPTHVQAVAYPGILFGGGGVQQIQLRTGDRENGDLGVVAP